jgi:hypothetical protein
MHRRARDSLYWPDWHAEAYESPGLRQKDRTRKTGVNSVITEPAPDEAPA